MNMQISIPTILILVWWVMDNYQQNYSEYRTDLTQDMIDKLLSQYQKSPVLISVMNVFCKQLQELYDVFVNMMESRCVGLATGEQLNVIGRIVGLRRGYDDEESAYYFRTDQQGISVDQGFLYCTGAPTDVKVILLNDQQYRSAIISKILSNFNKLSSIPELEKIVYQTLGTMIGFELTNPFEVRLYVQDNISSYNLNRLISFTSNDYCDDNPVVPYPASLSISDVIYFKPYKAFTTDSYDKGTDQGQLMVG